MPNAVVRGSLVLVAMVACLAGCRSAPRWAYDKPGADLATIDGDLVRCRRDSRSGWRHTVNETFVKRCMERLGYTAAPAP